MQLSDRALLVSLRISQWTARKLDKTATKQVNQLNYASDTAGRYNKSLLPANDLLDHVHKKTNLVRAEFLTNTLPWGIDGTRILPSANYLGFMAEFRKHKADWELLVNQFVQGYPDLQREAQHFLGRLYNPADYPDPSAVAGKFEIDMMVLPVPSDDFRVTLGDAEVSRLQAEMQQRYDSIAKNAMADVWSRLYERVKLIAERCNDPKSRIYDSLLDSARELCDLLPRLNLTDDPNLEAMRQAVEAQLVSVPTDAIRADLTVRKSTAETAEDIMAKMGAFMGGIN